MAKILIFSHYEPAFKAGGPIHSVRYICNMLKLDNEIHILSPSIDLDGTKLFYEDYWRNKNLGLNIIAQDNPSYYFVKQVIKKYNIDFVYLNSFFDYKTLAICFAIKARYNFQIILSIRGQLSKGAMRNRKFFKLFYLKFFKLFFSNYIYRYHSTCRDETLELLQVTKKDKIIQISNLRKIKINKNFFKAKKLNNEELNIIFYSRIVPKKNLLGAIQGLNKCRIKVNLDIYGTIEDKTYWEKCLNEIENRPKFVNYTYRGVLTPNLVLNTLTKYDFFYLPTFGENFGHVILEALYSGLPIIISSKTPFTNIVLKYNIGFIVDSKHNILDVINVIKKMDSIEYFKMKNNILTYLFNLIKITKTEELKYLKLFK